MRGSRPIQLPLFGPAGKSGAGGRSGRPAVAAAATATEPARKSAEKRREELFRRLSRLFEGRLHSLDLTDNRRTILTVKPARPGPPAPLMLRIHRSFVDAPEDTLEAVAVFASSRRGSPRSREALAKIREHFSRHCRTAATSASRRAALEPVGEVLDLRELRDEINREYFGGRLKVAITWGRALRARRCRRGGKATIQLGSYSYEDNLIRVHRTLDQPRVPRYVVEAVVYHEMLHAALPPVVRNGRRYVHTPEFRRREAEFSQLGRAERWIERHLPDLLRGRAAGG
jgi:predicted metal-dependent hydrolase